MDAETALLDRLIDANAGRAGSLITLLEAVQGEFQYLPPYALEHIAARLRLPLSHVYGVATFYNAFSLRPRGQHVVRVCEGTACHVGGSRRVVEEIARVLGIEPGQTTPDGRFSLEIVHCLGACSLAPVVVTDATYHGRMDPPQARALLAAPLAPAEPAAELAAERRPGAVVREVGDLARWREAVAAGRPRCAISLCGGPGCRPRSLPIAREFRTVLRQRGSEGQVEFRLTGCHGFCDQGPLTVVEPGDVMYRGVSARDVPEIVDALLAGEVVSRLLYVDPADGERVVRESDVPFYQRQTRLLLADNRRRDPAAIDDVVSAGGYEALQWALTSLTPHQVIETVGESGLRGRGGAGFPTAQKWLLCRRAPGGPKVVICNADEGDPGAFMDRSILEGDPHSVIEGMAIGAYAIGASRGVVYVRDEYPLAVEHLDRAITSARAHGLLGEDLFGTGFSFDLELVRGAGAFVCGEETALIASIEGQRGMPRAKPPFPATAGLDGLPTNINNVKTWKFVQVIVRDHFTPPTDRPTFDGIGQHGGRGTMLFSLVGKVRNPGLIEVPLGTTLRELVYDIGGGPAERPIKAVQIGGPSGGCIPEALFDTPLTYEALGEVGAILGSGGIIVLDETACMVDVARYFVHFTRDESCGKCVPCQMGTQQLAGILDRIVAGQGKPSDLLLLESLSRTMQQGSLCGLGKTAPNPVLTTLRYFREEYEAHIDAGCCPAGVCRELVRYWIDPAACIGCSLCRKACAAQAIVGEHKGVHVIDPAACVRCNACFEVCPAKVQAVHRLSGRVEEVRV